MPSRSPESEQWRRSTARTDLPLRGQCRHGLKGFAPRLDRLPVSPAALSSRAADTCWGPL